MSWGTCYSGSNNIHFDFPAIMSDRRNFASWKPGDVINKKIRDENNIKTNAQFRNYLVNNANSIMKANQVESCDGCGYCPAVNDGNCQSVPNSPFLYTSCMEKSQPYGYETSDLKNVYLSSYQLQCRMVAPILTQDQYLQQGYPNPN